MSVDTAWLPFPMFGRERSGTENVVWDRREGPDVRVSDEWYRERRWLQTRWSPDPTGRP